VSSSGAEGRDPFLLFLTMSMKLFSGVTAIVLVLGALVVVATLWSSITAPTGHSSDDVNEARWFRSSRDTAAKNQTKSATDITPPGIVSPKSSVRVASDRSMLVFVFTHLNVENTKARRLCRGVVYAFSLFRIFHLINMSNA